MRLRASGEALRRLRPGELADILEDLGRPGRQELLATLEPEQAADALEEMDPDELGALLRETPPEQAAALLANMEPDEAVDALRDLDEDDRLELLKHLDDEPREVLTDLLEYREDRAGGFMTTSLVTATADERVFVTRGRLRAEADHRGDIDAVAIVDDDGIYVDDVSLFALAIADADQTLGELLEECDPVAVGADHEVPEVAAQLIESRRSSVVVVDDRWPAPRAHPGRRHRRRPDARAQPVPLSPSPHMTTASAATDEVGAGAEEVPARPPVTRRRRFLTYLAWAGPGIIAANAGNDAGGIVTYASAGAQFGYRTLFFMVLVTVALICVQEMSARLGAFTGKGLAALIREEFSLRAATFALTCLILANIGLVVSEFAGIGAALELLGVSRYISIPIAAVAIWALVLFGSYRYAERIFLVLSLVFLAYPIAAILAHPDWGSVFSNTMLPHFLADKGFILLGVALIGTTITPYMQLYVAAAVADKGIGPEEYKFERIDAVGGALFGDIIAMFIIIAAAATIGHLAQPLTSAKEAAGALEPVAGRFAEQIFAIGLLGASALAGAVVPLSTAYAISEAVGVERSVSRSFAEAPLFLSLFTGQVIIGASVALAPGNLIDLLIKTQVLNGIITPIILIFILILANRRSLLGDAVNGPIFRVVATACVVGVSAMSAIVVIQSVLPWLGIHT